MTSYFKIQQGVNVLIAGLALQILSLVGFFGLYFFFMSRVFRNREFLDPRFCSVYLSAKFKTALLCESNVNNKVWNPKPTRNHNPASPTSDSYNMQGTLLTFVCHQACSWLWLWFSHGHSPE